MFFIRLFALSVRAILFPFLFLSCFVSVLLIPFVIFADCFHYLIFGFFKLVETYIVCHFNKVGFHWYFLVDTYLDKLSKF